ncbi:hypothetical protein, partial [Veillonella seminalis]
YNLNVRDCLYKDFESRDIMKKWFTVFCMALLVFVISGCGSDNALDSYSFGHKVIKSGNSEITVALPYDIGVQPNTTKNALGYPVTTYLGADKNFLVSIEAISPKAGQSLPTAVAYGAETRSFYEKNFGDKLTWSDEMKTVDGVTAFTSSATLIANQIQIRFFQYTFADKGVLWNITYQYPVDSTMGAQISDLVVGKIQITKKEG